MNGGRNRKNSTKKRDSDRKVEFRVATGTSLTLEVERDGFIPRQIVLDGRELHLNVVLGSVRIPVYFDSGGQTTFEENI